MFGENFNKDFIVQNFSAIQIPDDTAMILKDVYISQVSKTNVLNT